MAEVAAHVTDHVLAHLPVRQWVLSLPKWLRPFLEGNPYIASAVLRIFIRAVRTTLCRTSPDAPRVAQLPSSVRLQPRRALPLSRCRARWCVLTGAGRGGTLPRGRPPTYPSPRPRAAPRSFSPIQLLERVARLIPPPRVHRHRYHGVLAPNAKLRAAVTCIGRPEAETPAEVVVSRTMSVERYRMGLIVGSDAERIDVDVDASVTVACDADLMVRVVTNLLSNAIAVSSPDTRVDLSAHVVDGDVRIEVLDRGPGVADEHKDSIFDRFVQGPVAERTHSSGLGLTFCKLVMKAHGGSVTVQDRSGGGATFVADLLGKGAED